MQVFDEYNVSEIKWMDKSRHPALPDDEWAWTFAYELNGDLIPVVGALVDDLREKRYIDSCGYRITMKADKFLHRRRIE